ncbi:unnamed protein product [Ceratitis capitata]|uniref:(Mediterranean fruit fly) hypothetical protein n=1 Tax=Ceratitis capitata TaxID=7213 RepID=A0A811UUD8_CERCA|nr:unnamed protein product [Ceratitis capitata]
MPEKILYKISTIPVVGNSELITNPELLLFEARLQWMVFMLWSTENVMLITSGAYLAISLQRIVLESSAAAGRIFQILWLAEDMLHCQPMNDYIQFFFLHNAENSL